MAMQHVKLGNRRVLRQGTLLDAEPNGIREVVAELAMKLVDISAFWRAADRDLCF